MGSITLAALPRYLDKYAVRYRTHPGWLQRGRSSGGYDDVRGFLVHHSASSPGSSLASAITYCTETAADRPIAAGTVSRDSDGPIVVLWAGQATNHAGKGGPLWSPRGPIAQDNGNRVLVGFELELNGTTERLSEDVADLLVNLYAALVEWSRFETPGPWLEPGNIWGHYEWAPRRKIDPAGPSRFNGFQQFVPWDMNEFRGAVFRRMLAGPPGTPPAEERPDPRPDEPLFRAPTPPLRRGSEGPDAGALADALRWWGWMPDDGTREWHVGPAEEGGIRHLQAAVGVEPTGVYDGATARAFSDFVLALADLACEKLPPRRQLGDGPDRHVHALQWLLRTRGWYDHDLDGVYGPRTEIGVQHLQRHMAAIGLYDGAIHGQFDSRTRVAACSVF